MALCEFVDICKIFYVNKFLNYWTRDIICISLNLEPVGCVSNLLVSTVSANQISLAWDAPTASCPADVYQITYEIINADQCFATVTNSASVILDWQTDNFATLDNLKAYTSYKIVVTGAVRDISDNTVITPGMSMEVNQDTAEDGKERCVIWLLRRCFLYFVLVCSFVSGFSFTWSFHVKIHWKSW